MMVRCRKCGAPFKDDDEVTGVFKAYWKTLASRVSYSVTKPHDCDQDTLAHVQCVEGETV